MYLAHRYLFLFTICCLLTLGTNAALRAQFMTAVVNSTADDGDAHPWDDPDTPDIDESVDGICKDAAGRCTLRAALEEAAAMGLSANVTFSVDGTITVMQVAPYLTNTFSPPSGSVIDASSANIVITGQDTMAFLMGLQDNTTIRGILFTHAMDAIDVGGVGNIIGGSQPAERNAFLGIKQNAILLAGDNNLVIGNKIGIAPSNAYTDGGRFGVFVVGSNNTIGGTQPGQQNIISGLKVSGIAIAADTSDGRGGGNKIIGNRIGTDATGTQKMPNAAGIQVLVDKDAMIGGPSAAERNIISGNTTGIEIGIEAHDVTVDGNYIGLDISGAALGNRDGVALAPGAHDCLVKRNLIKENTGVGLVISGGTGALATTNHRISGNDIMWNKGHGIMIKGNATDNVIGSSPTQPFDSNRIYYNGQSGSLNGGGIYVLANNQGTPAKNTFRKNDFVGNTADAINFDDANPVQDGITPPTILTYEDVGPGNVYVTGRHDRPGSLIDIYVGKRYTGSTVQGRRWLGSDYVDLDSTFTVQIQSPCNCDYLVATATDIFKNTSEFTAPAFQVSNTTLTAQFGVNAGANMVSVPVGAPNSSVNSVFPGASSSAYSWIGPTIAPGTFAKTSGGSYVPQDTLISGAGYWIKFNGPSTDSITGTNLSENIISVHPGWNLIGSISGPEAVANIGSVPDGMETSQFFGYEGTYQVADTIRPGKAYWVKVNQQGALMLTTNNTLQDSSLITIVPDSSMPPPPPAEVLLGVTDTKQPLAFLLKDAFPNPFNPSTTIDFEIAKPAFTSLKIYDVLGREVTTLVNERLGPGVHRRVWNASGVASGIYFYKIVTVSVSDPGSTFSQIKKMVLIK